MAAEISQPSLRRAAILRILGESAVHKQDELVQMLRKQGFEATQSSVSRDLRELGVAKAGDRYLVPAGDETAPSARFNAVAGFVRSVQTAGPTLTVVHTATGTAQPVAVAIDKARWPEVVGTISGDDTIFIATAGAREQRSLLERLRGILRV